ncbi:mechanosensitive ion channel family protein [Novosphingobium mangrovi (ex Huang et al. 2023)]|uniref:Small-conductance mechanosensitive channel n=1 Tax=Novosphingobium mangrovi (ex Huang et al. 2023) TaxID=2976432 RepID=A0ABT2I3T1_9SPHN|nr:mechanosensitive ion channel family protein [Novosphingobium mangrovi (ex Huang et al. 2023)]MCT2399464.1 mechanosensitive ion channel family protein [Novosphingobium mangrovi (ex Huang et al. 2023)]
MDYITTLQNQLQSMSESFVHAVPSLIIALAILLVTFVVTRFATKITNRITRHAQIRRDLRQLLETLVRLGIWVGGVIIALTVAVPSFTPGSAFAGLGIGALAIGFAFQDIFENFLAGVLIMLRDKMDIDDVIECNGILGRVEQITLRETHIRQLSNELTVVPNSMLFKNPVKIITDAALRRNEVIVGVSYDTDLEQAEKIITDTLESIEHVSKDKPVLVVAQEFNSSSVDFLVQWWSDSLQRDLRMTKGDVIKAIKRALDDAEIEIPFPYVTHTFKEPLLVNKAG